MEFPRSIKAVSCCFTGHRPEKLGAASDGLFDPDSPIRLNLRAAIERAWEDGYTHFICGMARGSDMAFALEVLRLKAREQGIRLEAAIPCPQQPERWSSEEKKLYHNILSRCDMISVISSGYTRSCMMERNRYMTRHSDRLIALYNKTGGGTAKTIDFARLDCRETEIIDPSDL